MPTDSEMRSRRDSWPPTQVVVTSPPRAKDEPRPLLDIDDDPLTYFLTPAPDADDNDLCGDVMDFDAGIEDSNHQRDIVRSVSPSTLDGLRKPKLRSPSPESSSSAATSDEDEDEDFIHFHSTQGGFLSPQHGPLDSFRLRPRSPIFGRRPTPLLSVASFPAPQLPPRGRSYARAPRRLGPSRSLSATARLRPSHLWREPSPDVWSIEEETEEELLSEVGESSMVIDTGDGVDTAAAKPKKKVRFVLPDEEQ